MKKEGNYYLPWIVISCITTVAITTAIFNTAFARITVDYFAFIASIILIVDGSYKIFIYKNDPYFPNHFIRHLRIIIGVCIFTIHLLQVIYGV